MFSVIVPTLGTRELELKRLLYSLVEQNNVEIEVIIIAQDNHALIQKVVKEFCTKLKVNVIPTNKKGLSLARNIGLKYITGSIVVFSDDDCWYPKNIFNKIKSQIENSEICTYQIFDPDSKEHFKPYAEKGKVHKSYFSTFKVASIEIFINTNKVNKEEIIFDEDFGLGAKYPSGEENTLLIDLIKKNYSISYYPEIAVYHKKPDISFNKNDLEVTGAFLSRNFSLPIALILGFGFYMKKIKIINNRTKSLFSVIKGCLSYNK